MPAGSIFAPAPRHRWWFFPDLTADEVRAFLEGQVAKWWLPDAIEFVSELPHTASGKLSKKDLRDQYRNYRFANADAMVGRD